MSRVTWTVAHYAAVVSTVALALSGCSLYVAKRAYDLSIVRDQRELPDKKPAIDLQLRPAGVSTLSVTIEIINRSDINIVSHANLLERGFHPILVAAGVTMPGTVLDEQGKPIINNAGEPVMRDGPKYEMHALRHACASLWIESGYNPKQIQRLMGHSSIKVTFDVYGHPFADAEADQRAAQSVQNRLLGV